VRFSYNVAIRRSKPGGSDGIKSSTTAIDVATDADAIRSQALRETGKRWKSADARKRGSQLNLGMLDESGGEV
jgi:hypothetical protein